MLLTRIKSLFMMIDHPHLKPKSITQPETVNLVAKDFMYFRCIQSIYEVRILSLQFM